MLLHVLNASAATDIDAAFAALVQRGAGLLLMGADLIFQRQVIALAALHKVPAIYECLSRLAVWALTASDSIEGFRQVGIYVSRILNGAKPAELPVVRRQFELVVNLKTAKALGLKIEDSFLRLADEVIE